MKHCKKPNSNWTLCPSKSIPGKFYYFNVATGEAVWGVDDTSGNTPKKDNNIHRIIVNKSHMFHEPNPPDSIQKKFTTSNMHATNYISQSNLVKPSPSFGQTVFPQYFSNTPSVIPGVVWTPMQVPMPMFMTNREEKHMLDQNTQTSECGDLVIQTCNMPLSKRFAMLRCNNDLENSRKPLVHSSPQPSQNWWNISSLDNYNQSNEQQSKRKLDLCPIIKEPKLKFVMQTDKSNDTPSDKNIQSNIGNTEHSSEQYVDEILEKQEDMLQNLDKTDLRYLLISKRRKSNDFVALASDKKEKKNKTTKEAPVRKKVTFNLNIDDNISEVSILDNYDTLNSTMPISLLRNLGKIQDLFTNWYIATDRDVLFEHYNFITDYINSDEFCKLLLPKSLVKSIESSGFGDGGLPQVLAARQIYRKIMFSNKVEIVCMEECMSLNDQVINCCLQAINGGKHIVLITKNIKLLERASFFGIHAYSLDDIINYVQDASPQKLQTKNNKNTFTLSKNVAIFDNLKNNKFSVENNVALKNNRQDGDENTINFTEISNVNRNIQKIDLNSSKELKRIFNNDKNSFKPLIFRKIYSKYENINKTQEKLSDCQNGSNKENGGPFENVTLSTDNDNIHTDKEGNKEQIEFKDTRFHIKDKSMEYNIATRISEFSCCYVQIMEEFINTLLEKNAFAKRFLPCFLHEGLECLMEFCWDVKIKNIIEKLLLVWRREDKTKKDIKPNVFMYLLHYSWLLINLFKDSIPHAIQEINHSFKTLLDNIKNPIVEDIELIQTPVLIHQDNINRSIYVKSELEIVRYLKKHFIEWEHFEMSHLKNDGTNDDTDRNIDLLRTSGRHLKSFKIDNKKRITFSGESLNQYSNNNIKNSNVSMLEKNKNVIKIVRNVKLIREFEEKLKHNQNETLQSVSSIIVNDESGDSKVVDSELDNTRDSGFETESQTCYFLRNFLIYLSATFKLIFDFVEKCRNDFQDGCTEEGDRKYIYEKARQTYKEMNKIIDKLKNIIERESKENTKLKTLLIKAGQDVSEDKRMTRYRQTIIKCWEQAQILNNGLKLILNTNEDVTDNISTNSYDISYFNIFE